MSCFNQEVNLSLENKMIYGDSLTKAGLDIY